MPKITAKFERDHPIRGRQVQVGWVKIGHFQRKTCYNSKTVQDRRIVSIYLLDLFRVNKQLAWEIEKKDVPCTIADRCRVISELLCIKFKFLNMPLLSCAEIDCAISFLCTD